MAIKQREIVQQAVHWTHLIKSRHFDCRFQVSRQDRVINADPAIHWSIGQRFDSVREICSRRGYELIDLRPKKSKLSAP